MSRSSRSCSKPSAIWRWMHSRNCLQKNADDRRPAQGRPVLGYARDLGTACLPARAGPAVDTAVSGATRPQCGLTADHAGTSPAAPAVWLSTDLSVVAAARPAPEQEACPTAVATSETAGSSTAAQAPSTDPVATATGDPSAARLDVRLCEGSLSGWHAIADFDRDG